MATISGTAKNDILSNTSGSDSVDGGLGSDVLIYQNSMNVYQMSLFDNQFQVSDGAGNVDTLNSVENLYFSGDGHSVEIYRDIVLEQSELSFSNVASYSLSGGKTAFFFDNEDTRYFKVYNSDGNQVSELVKLPEHISSEKNLSVSFFSNDNFVIAWEDDDQDGTGIFVQKFDAEGNALSSIARVNNTQAASQEIPTVVINEDDSFLVIWRSENQSDSTPENELDNSGVQFGDTPNNSGTYFRYFNENAQAIGFESQLTPSAQAYYRAESLSNGNFALVYEAEDAESTTINIYFDIYGPTGQVVNLATKVNQFNEEFEGDAENELRGESKLPVTASLTGGGFVIAWQSPTDGYNLVEAAPAVDYDRSIMYRVFSNDGTAQTIELKANTYTKYEQSNPAIAPLSNGGFVIVWQSQLQDQSYFGIYGQMFDAAGNKVGSEIAINDNIFDSQQLPTVSGSSDGGFYVAWESLLPSSGQDSKIVYQRFDSSGNNLGLSLLGTSEDDNLSISSDQNIQIDGLAGDDSITGSDQTDTLIGGLGDDTLDGGLGADSLLGGVGDDVYLVDDVGDIVTEAADAGQDEIRSSFSYTLSTNVENLTLTGTAASGTGNALDNTITGNASANTLNGDLGNDTLDGGLGNDTVSGGDGEDVWVLGGLKSDYIITGDNGVYVITDTRQTPENQGVDVLSEIETLQFSDGSLDLIGDIDTSPGINYVSAKNIAEVVNGTVNQDTLAGGGNAAGLKLDTLQGGEGNDIYVALGSAFVIFDTNGVDTLRASTISVDLSKAETSKIKGLAQIEDVELTGKRILNASGNDLDNLLTGNDAKNVLKGNAGEDELRGGLGTDALYGGDGDDTLIGGLGKDRLQGDEGNDIFILNTPLIASNVDTIVDFGNGSDVFQYDATIFAGLDDDDDGIINFVSGAKLKAAITDTASFMVYDTSTGNLYYDEAGEKALLVAKLLKVDGLIPELDETFFEALL